MIGFTRPWFLLLLTGVPLLVHLLREQKSRRRITGVLRTLAFTLMVLASAGPVLRGPSDKVSAVFIADVSDSMGQGGERRVFETVNRLVSGMQTTDEAGLVTVGERAVLEVSPRPGGGDFQRTAAVSGGESRLADAVYTAAAALGGDGERRIVLISDGRSTDGNLPDAALFARRSGITVDVLGIGPASGDDVSIEAVETPERAREGEVHNLSVLLQATGEAPVRLVIFRDGEYFGEDRFTVPTGQSRRNYDVPAGNGGTREYEIILDVPGDSIPENNRGLAAVRVDGPSKVLWVGSGFSAIPEALKVQGIVVEQTTPGDLPDRLEFPGTRDTVILDNVSAREMSTASMALLEAWVRRGGGLFMSGGDAGFGPGGWQFTPVEDALPVSMDAPSSLYIPSLAMVMVIDKSGSMGSETETGLTKLDLVKDAVMSAVEVLNPFYTVGLIAFDADWEWTIPITETRDENRIRQGLTGLHSGGGTVLYPAIREAYEKLVQSPAAVRHLVILSDGLAERADYAGLAAAIARDGITVSTVAVGDGADADLMKALAEGGGGRYWFAETADRIPRIFASESMIVSRGLTVEDTIFPEAASPAEALEGIDLTTMPPLHGYVITVADPSAITAVQAPRGHPLLVYGYHGLGRTAAFTSDFRSLWGRDWAAWEELPKILSQSVRWMGRSPVDVDRRLSTYPEAGDVRVVLEARTYDGRFESALLPVGSVRIPDGTERGFSMNQTAPGRYEGRFTADRDGVYRISVSDKEGSWSEWTLRSRSYSPELRAPGLDTGILAQTAREGGGLLLAGTEDPEQWWTVRRPIRRTRADFTLVSALAALVLFLTDIFLREIPGGVRRPEADYGRMIIHGMDADRMKPDTRRPTAAEAARILAERRARREDREKIVRPR